MKDDLKGREVFLNLDIPWRGDERLEPPTIAPIPDVRVQEIVEDLEAALKQFRESRRKRGTS